MTPRFVLEFQDLVQDPVATQLLTALRQEPVIWESLLTTPLGSRALSEFAARKSAASPEGDGYLLSTDGYESEFWSPASLALLALKQPISLSNLRDPDFSMLELEIHQKAKEAFQTWESEPANIQEQPVSVLRSLDLQTAGLIALSIREQWVFYGNWAFIEELVSTHKRTIKPALVCLFGFLADPTEFFHYLYSIHPELGIDVLLANPLSDQERLQILSTALPNLSRDHFTKTITYIHSRRPLLARQMADWAEKIFGSITPDELDEFHPGRIHTLENFLEAVQSSYQGALALAQVRENTPSVIPLYLQALHFSRRLQAFIHAQIAMGLSWDDQCLKDADEHISAALEAWEQAIQCDPGEVAYRYRYTALLAKLGRLDLADEALISPENKPLETQARPEDFSLKEYAHALIAYKRGDWLSALQAIQRIARADLERLTQNEIFELASSALALEDPASSLILANHILNQQPDNPSALAIQARSYLALEKYQPALIAASLAQFLQPQPDHQRLLVEALIANNDFHTAYQASQQITSHPEAAQAADWRTQAKCAVYAGLKEETLLTCQKALEIDPQDGLTLEIMGDLARSVNDIDTAIVYYREAIQLSPHQPSPWLSLSQLYQTLGREQDLLETLTLACQAVPDSPEIFFALGEAYRQRAMLTEALVPFRLAANLLFTSHYTLKTAQNKIYLGYKITNSLGYTLFMLGYPDEARSIYERILSFDYRPTDSYPSIAYGYAKSLVSLGQIDQALPWFSQVVKWMTTQNQVILDYARTLLTAYNQAGKPEHLTNAIVYLKQLSSLPADPSEIISDRPNQATSWIWEETHQEDLAIFFAEVHALLAESLYKSGERNESMQAYLKALDSPLIQQPAWRYRLSLGLGKIAVELNQPDTAIAALLEAQQINPREAELHCSLSTAYLALKLPSDAYRSAVDAIRLTQNDPEMLVWFSDQCLKIAEVQEAQASHAEPPSSKAVPAKKAAQKALERAISLAPDQAGLHVRLAKVQMLLGDLNGAQQSLLALLDHPDPTNTVNLDSTPPNEVLAENTDSPVGHSHPPIKASLAELRQSADLLCAMNQPGLAVLFLEQAIRQSPVEVSLDLDLRQAELYEQLSFTYHLSGDLSASLRAIEQSIQIDPRNASYIRQEVKLLQGLNRLEEAKSSLEKLAVFEQDNPGIYLELALVAFAQGSLLDALKYADLALKGYSKLDNRLYTHFSRWFSAEIAHALFMDERAIEYLAGYEEQPLLLESILLSAEIYLHNQQLKKTTQALAAVLPHCDHHPRLLAIQARLLARQEGPTEAARNLLSEAAELAPASILLSAPQFTPEKLGHLEEQVEPPEQLCSILAMDWHFDRICQLAPYLPAPDTDGREADFYQQQLQRLVQISLHRSIACAADELSQWKLADQFSTSYCLLAPDLPIAHLQRIQFLVRCAEKELIYHDLQVVTHAPGEEAYIPLLSGEIANHLLRAEACLETENPVAQMQINRWRVRSEVVLNTLHHQPGSLKELDFPSTIVPDIEDIACKLRQRLLNGEEESATKSIMEQLHQPLLAIIYSTSLFDHNPETVIDLATNALNRLVVPDLSLPDPIPLLHFTLAKGAYHQSQRESSNLTAQKTYLDLALKAIQSALELWPDEPRWHIFAGELLCAVHEMTKQEALQAQMEAHPEVADLFLDTEFLTAALTHYQRAVQLEPGNGDHYLHLGHLLEQLGEPEQALQAFSEATQVNPDLVDAWLEQSRIQKDKGEIEKAIYSAERALETRSQFTEALLLRSELALMANNPRGALSRAQTILKENPDHVQAWYVLALAMEALNQPAEALSALDKAIQYHREFSKGNSLDNITAENQVEGRSSRTFPDDATYLGKFAPLRARLVHALNGPHQAIQNLRLYLADYPNDPHLNAMLAEYSLEIGDQNSALQAAHLALQSSKISPEALTTLDLARLHLQIGQICRQTGQLDQAIFHLNQAIQMYSEENALPDEYEACLELGRAYQDRRQTTKALETYESASRINPKDYRAFYMAGLALREAKDYHEAELMLRQAAHLAPNEVGIHRQLAAVVALNLVHNRRLVTPE